jgi:hypothetical protein
MKISTKPKPMAVAVTADDKERSLHQSQPLLQQKTATESPAHGSNPALHQENSQRRGRFEVTSSSSTSPSQTVTSPVDMPKPGVAVSSSVPASAATTKSTTSHQNHHPFAHQHQDLHHHHTAQGIHIAHGVHIEPRVLEQMLALAEQQRNLLSSLLGHSHQHGMNHSSPSSSMSTTITQTLATLQNQVHTLQLENESLREENAKLRTRLTFASRPAPLDASHPPNQPPTSTANH